MLPLCISLVRILMYRHIRHMFTKEVVGSQDLGQPGSDYEKGPQSFEALWYNPVLLMFCTLFLSWQKKSPDDAKPDETVEQQKVCVLMAATLCHKKKTVQVKLVM